MLLSELSLLEQPHSEVRSVNLKMTLPGLERWLSLQEHVLCLQRTESDSSTHARWILQLPVTPATGNLILLLGFLGISTHVAHTCTGTHKVKYLKIGLPPEI